MRRDVPRIEVPDDEMVRILRAKTGAERLRMASEMYSAARRMLVSHLTAEHPDWDEAAIEREASRRLLGDDDLWRAMTEREQQPG